MSQNNQNNMNTNTTPNPTDFELDSILDAPSEELMSERKPEWINPEKVLYEAMVVTRANLRQQFDERKGHKVERANVNFYKLDDPSQTPYVFSVGWMSVRNQIAQLLARQAFPVTCALVEMRDKVPFTDDNGVDHYPLRFVSLAQLEALEVSATIQEPPQEPVQEPSPAPQPEPPARYTPPRSGYRQHGDRS